MPILKNYRPRNVDFVAIFSLSHLTKNNLPYEKNFMWAMLIFYSYNSIKLVLGCFLHKTRPLINFFGRFYGSCQIKICSICKRRLQASPELNELKIVSTNVFLYNFIHDLNNNVFKSCLFSSSVPHDFEKKMTKLYTHKLVLSFFSIR